MSTGLHRVMAVAGMLGALISSAAELTWPTPVVQFVAPPGAANVEAVFPCQNNGNVPVRIVQVDAVCRCLDASATPAEIAPGAAGAVRAVFTLGELTGPQEKHLYILTEPGGSRRVELVLKVDIPVLARLEPQVLVWKKDAPLEEKSARFTVHAPDAVAGVSLVQPQGNMQAALEPTSVPNQYRLTVQPRLPLREGVIPVSVSVRLRRGGERTFTVMALVR
ncbi:MAG: DUF1573 domain-containing protein [Opitutae bacterium]|nr:DUF1573 domain-containing protein [Opitutae bacterium]